MKRLIFATTLTLMLLTGTLGVIAQDKPGVAELAVAKLEKAPELKAELNEIWKSAAMVEVSTFYGSQSPGPNVELRALHDGEYIYLMARWADDTKSETKKAWEFKDGAWTVATGDEDRFAVALEGSTTAFAVDGCASLCHDGAMSTAVKGQHADLWHWKAARGGQNGHADDQQFIDAKEGRIDDAGKSAYEGNASEDKKSPKWVWGEKADTTGAFTADSSRDLPADFKPEDGYSVPSIRLRAPESSRGDIQSASEYKDGWWTVVLKRKLDTGNTDDTALKPGETTHIAIATFNNTGAKTGKEHAKSHVIKLNLAK